MSTLATALEKKLIRPIEVPSWESRLPIRPLSYAPAFMAAVSADSWFSDVKNGHGKRTPLEQLEQAFADFRCSLRPAAGDLRRMMPTPKGIWSLHVGGMRVYGWAVAVDHFVVVDIAKEEDTKSIRSLNDTKRQSVELFIKNCGLQKSVVLGDIRVVFPQRTIG